MSESSVEHLWTVVCRNVLTGADGLLTLDGLIDMVNVPDLPTSEAVAVPFNCFVVSQWRRNDDHSRTLSQRLMLQREKDPASRVQLAGPDVIDVRDQHLFMVINQIPMLPLRGHAQYWFVLQRQDGDDDAWQDAPPRAGLWVPPPDAFTQYVRPLAPHAMPVASVAEAVPTSKPKP